MNLHTSSSKDFGPSMMHTPKSDAVVASISAQSYNPEGPQTDTRSKNQRSASKYAAYKEQIRQSSKVQKNRTPARERSAGKGLRKSRELEPTESDARLNKLIADYRAENERCTAKINELKERLADQRDAPREGRSTSTGPTDKIYAKSFKVTS